MYSHQNVYCQVSDMWWRHPGEANTTKGWKESGEKDQVYIYILRLWSYYHLFLLGINLNSSASVSYPFR